MSAAAAVTASSAVASTAQPKKDWSSLLASSRSYTPSQRAKEIILSNSSSCSSNPTAVNAEPVSVLANLSGADRPHPQQPQQYHPSHSNSVHDSLEGLDGRRKDGYCFSGHHRDDRRCRDSASGRSGTGSDIPWLPPPPYRCGAAECGEAATRAASASAVPSAPGYELSYQGLAKETADYVRCIELTDEEVRIREAGIQYVRRAVMRLWGSASARARQKDSQAGDSSAPCGTVSPSPAEHYSSRYTLDDVNVYGSYALGLSLPSSDIDMAVSFKPISPKKPSGVEEAGAEEGDINNDLAFSICQLHQLADHLKAHNASSMMNDSLNSDSAEGSKGKRKKKKKQSCRVVITHAHVREDCRTPILHLEYTVHSSASGCSGRDNSGRNAVSPVVKCDVSIFPARYIAEMLRRQREWLEDGAGAGGRCCPAAVKRSLVLLTKSALRQWDCSVVHRGGISSTAIYNLVARFLSDLHQCPAPESDGGVQGGCLACAPLKAAPSSLFFSSGSSSSSSKGLSQLHTSTETDEDDGEDEGVDSHSVSSSMSAVMSPTAAAASTSTSSVAGSEGNGYGIGELLVKFWEYMGREEFLNGYQITDQFSRPSASTAPVSARHHNSAGDCASATTTTTTTTTSHCGGHGAVVPALDAPLHADLTGSAVLRLPEILFLFRQTSSMLRGLILCHSGGGSCAASLDTIVPRRAAPPSLLSTVFVDPRWQHRRRRGY